MSLAICVIEQVGAGFQYVLDTRVSKSPLSWNVHSVQLSGLADSEQTPPRDIVSLGATKGDSTGNFQQEPGNANARQRMTYADGQHAGAERQGNSATTVVTCLDESIYDASRMRQKICNFIQNHSRSRKFRDDHRVSVLGFHKCFTRGSRSS